MLQIYNLVNFVDDIQGIVYIHIYISLCIVSLQDYYQHVKCYILILCVYVSLDWFKGTSTKNPGFPQQ